MSFYDHYVSEPALSCPVCGEALEAWTGVDGPCVFLTFRQGVAGGTLPDCWGEPAVDGSTVLDPAIARAPHPDVFEIESDSCGCEFSTRARCASENGVWKRSEVLTGSPGDRLWKGSERRAQYRRRMKWLDGELRARDGRDGADDA